MNRPTDGIEPRDQKLALRLTKTERDIVEIRAAHRGHSSLSGYVRALVATDAGLEQDGDDK